MMGTTMCVGYRCVRQWTDSIVLSCDEGVIMMGTTMCGIQVCETVDRQYCLVTKV